MRAFVTGASGQDGSYLMELLLSKGYEVYGLIRRHSHDHLPRIEHLRGQVNLLEGDVLDQMSLTRALQESKPDEVYNLAAQSFVGVSFKEPAHTAEVTGIGALKMLEAVHQTCPQARFYQASSSEQFGEVLETPQDENTPFHPRSPYGCAKVFAHHAAVLYREAYGMHVSCGILFNHESPRRGKEFVTKKIASYFGKLAASKENEIAEVLLKGLAPTNSGGAQKSRPMLELGNLDAFRDWGYAPEYVEAMWRMLQQEQPGDYVISTGESHSVREFAEVAMDVAEVGGSIKDWAVSVETQKRPAEVENLRGDYSKAKAYLKWEPKVRFKELVKIMVEAELNGSA